MVRVDCKTSLSGFDAALQACYARLEVLNTSLKSVDVALSGRYTWIQDIDASLLGSSLELEVSQVGVNTGSPGLKVIETRPSIDTFERG